jgi:hypothetical protein
MLAVLTGFMTPWIVRQDEGHGRQWGDPPRSVSLSDGPFAIDLVDGQHFSDVVTGIHPTCLRSLEDLNDWAV